MSLPPTGVATAAAAPEDLTRDCCVFMSALRSEIPSDLYFKNELLPGSSFFELASTAFPQNRIVLNEHFRCQEGIIQYSNSKYYRGRLTPLRIPTADERLDPSIVDVLLEDGVKQGKVNQREALWICNDIVRLVEEGGGRVSLVEIFMSFG